MHDQVLITASLNPNGLKLLTSAEKDEPGIGLGGDGSPFWRSCRASKLPLPVGGRSDGGGMSGSGAVVATGAAFNVVPPPPLM